MALSAPQPGPASQVHWQVRPWQAGDARAALTALLHRAFAPLAAAGMTFTAASQTEAMAGQRLRHGHGLVAEQGGQIVGTVTVNGACDPNRQAWARATPWFYRDDVAHLHQLAVDPAAQGQGIGAALMQAADAFIRVNAVYPEGWALQILEVTPVCDGRVHSMAEVQHAGQRFLAHTLWRFDAGLIVRADQTWATVAAPPAWRHAPTLGAYRRDEVL